MIRAVIIEDESKNVALLKKMLSAYCPAIMVEGYAGSVDAAFNLIQHDKPDIVFLDIELIGGNAFALLDKLSPVNFAIIFITAFESYALKAIKYSALDYLMKPINITELVAAVNKVSDKLHSHQIQERVEILLKNTMSFKKDPMITIPAKSGFEFVNTELVVRLESARSYTNFILNDGRKILSIKHLKDYEDMLSKDLFIRVHNSHIVNKNFVNRYHKGKLLLIEMTNKEFVPLSPARRPFFFEFMNIKG